MIKVLIQGISAALLVCLSTVAQAQSHGWQYLANTGLPTTFTRFEDVYFTDTLTGYAVALGNASGTAIKDVYKTTDGGNSWTQVGPTIDGSDQLRSIEFLDDHTTCIVGSLTGSVYRSTDACLTWSDISGSLSDTITTDVSWEGTKNICGLAHYGNNFYGVGWWGGTHGRFYKSTDKGLTWNTTYIDTSLAVCLVDAVFVSADTGFITGGKNMLPISSFPSSDESVILKTTDGGNTWTKVFSDTVFGGRIWKIQFIDRMNAVASIEPYYYPDSVNMARSYDGGNTWTIIHAGSTIDSAVNWTGCITQGVGFANTQIGWLGGYYRNVFQTSDGGATWSLLHFGSTFNRIFVIDSAHVFAGGQVVYKWTLAADSDLSVRNTIPPPAAPHILYDIKPNPVSGKVKIEFDLLSLTNVVLQVVNIDGRKHYDVARGLMKPGHYTYYWDGTAQPDGNYMIWLGTDQIPLVRKFVLRH
jgi:photosystem II stability/assembly factor-like uncharacterized protein